MTRDLTRSTAALGLALLAAAGCRTNEPGDGRQLTGGEASFARHCSQCHALDAGSGETANPRAVSFEGSAELGSQSDEYLFEVIKKGGADNLRSPEMHAFGDRLSDEEVRELIAYLRTKLESP